MWGRFHHAITSLNFVGPSRPKKFAAVAITTLIALQLHAEEPTFCVDTQFVAVDVQVLSKQAPVTGLTQQDFLVWDNGKPQQIVSMEHDEIELDLILLIDVSASTREAQMLILESAEQAMSRLHLRDRVGIVAFNLAAHLIQPLTWDRTAILRTLNALPRPQGATEISTVLRNTALYLKKQSRPGARRVIVALTDNVGYETSTDDQVREDLWKTDTIVNAILFKPTTGGGEADIKTFVKDTGGETIDFRQGELPLVELFERIRKRYVLFYRPPAGQSKSVHKIRVELTKTAKSRYKDRTIRARTGYVADPATSPASLPVPQ
jgi:VWFA-related protein